MSEKRIQLFPGDNFGCGYYRMRAPGRALQQRGHNLLIREDGQLIVNGQIAKHDDGSLEVRGGGIPAADIVVVQRPSTPMLVAAIRFLRDQGMKVVVELDDHFDAIVPSNAAYAAYQGEDMNAAQIHLACQAASLVTVSTPGLASVYAKDNPNIVVLENCVPEWVLGLPEHEPGQTLGWCGAMASHRGDFDITRNAVPIALSQVPGWRFRAIGESEGIAKELGMDEDAVSGTGWVPEENFMIEMSRLDAAIAPLDDNPFNVQGKSWLKPLQAAAVGVPIVASDVPEYRRLGVGLLAGNHRHWRGALTTLLKEDNLRAELAAQGREIAREWTYEKRAHLWLDAWENA